MKVYIESANIELNIKARKLYNKKASKKDALSFLNLVSILAHESALYTESLTKQPCDYREAIANEIYEICKKEGLYN